jgi:hypothetical protein
MRGTCGQQALPDTVQVHLGGLTQPATPRGRSPVLAQRRQRAGAADLVHSPFRVHVRRPGQEGQGSGGLAGDPDCAVPLRECPLDHRQLAAGRVELAERHHREPPRRLESGHIDAAPAQDGRI